MLRFRQYLNKKELWFEEIYYETKQNGSYNSINLLEEFIPKLSKNKLHNSFASAFRDDFEKFTNGKLTSSGKDLSFSNSGNLTDDKIKDALQDFLGEFLLNNEITILEPGEDENISAKKPAVNGVGKGSSKYRGFYFQIDLQDEIGELIPALVIIRGGADYSTSETEVTEKQEICKLLILAAMYGGSIKEIEDVTIDNIIGHISNVYIGESKISKSKVEDVIGWLVSKDAWKVDSFKTAVLMKNDWSKKPERFVKDDASLEINKLAKSLWKENSLVQSQNIRWSSDKWNPADVWLMYSGYDDSSHKSLSALNKYLKDCTISAQSGSPKGILGVSLKQNKKNTHAINYYNLEKTSQLKVVADDNVPYGIIARFGSLFSQNIYTDYNIGTNSGTTRIWSIVYRTFMGHSEDTIRGEAMKQSSDARHGKVNLSALERVGKELLVKSGLDLQRVVNTVRGGGIIEQGDGEWKFTVLGKNRFKTISRYWRSIKSGVSLGIIYEKTKKDTGIDVTAKRSSEDIPDSVNLLQQYKALGSEKEFIEAINEFAKSEGLVKGRGLDFRDSSREKIEKVLSARFQCLALGSIFVRLAKRGKSNIIKVASTMINIAKSTTALSAAHAKVE